MLERIATFINIHLNKSYQTTSILGKFQHALFSTTRAILIKLGDPACKMEIRGKIMYIPLSHPLAFNVAMKPHYDGVIERLSEFIRNENGCLNYIDVGANIGDTILFCNPGKYDQILGIDADELYLEYFRRNLGHLLNVKHIKAICASTDSQVGGIIKRSQGTAKIVEDKNSLTISRKLDSIIEEYDEFRTLNLLKVDTDGYDFDVLQGAANIISQNKPTILFECEFNDNEKYVEQFIHTVQFFKEFGYQSALLYDNFGILFSRIELDNITHFKYPLFYQLNRDYYYYDILVMPERQLQKFLKLEITYYCSLIKNRSIRQAAQDASKL